MKEQILRDLWDIPHGLTYVIGVKEGEEWDRNFIFIMAKTSSIS